MPKKVKKASVEKPIYFGVYGNERAKYIKETQPALFKELKDSGTLNDYLEGYQQAYVLRADALTKEYEKKWHVTPWLQKVNYAKYCELCYKIQQAVRDEIMKSLRS